MRPILSRRLTRAFALVSLCAGFGSQAASPALAIEHVTVLPMTKESAPLVDMTVSIESGAIKRIEPSRSAAVAAGVRRIDGRGKWLMPALVDMHVHIENDRLLRLFTGDASIPDGTVEDAEIFAPYVANGVLQVLNTAAMSEAIGQRIAIESGRVLGPHMALAALVDGAPPIWPIGFARAAATPEDGRQLVRDIRAEGYDYVKTYSKLDLATFTAIVDEARQLKMKVLGHIPMRGQGITEKFFQPGYELVAHAEEFAYQSSTMSDEDIERFAAIARRNGTALISTLVLNERIVEQMRSLDSLTARPEMRYVHPIVYAFWTRQNPYAKSASPQRIERLSRVVEFNRKLVRAFVRADIPVLPGTDAFVPGMVAGFSLHDELAALTRAGMSNEQALTAATRVASEWLGVAHDRGTVEVGKQADLLLLAADPLAEIANTRKIAAVLVCGRYLARSELDTLLARVAARYAAQAPYVPPTGPPQSAGTWPGPEE